MVASVEGHTDTTATTDHNQTLSEERSQAVYDYLVAHGVPASRLTRVSFGESQLAVDTGDRLNDAEAGTAEALNRRVELTVDRLIYTGSANGFNDSAASARYFIPAQPDRGVLIRLSADVDRSGGAHNGRIYVAFADQGDLDHIAATGHDNLDIFVIASDDGGNTWLALHDSPKRVGADQVRVNDDTGLASQFFSWLDVDQTTGNVAVSWYDTRNDVASGNDDAQYFAAFSTDGGFTWSTNVRVSDGTSNGHAAGAFNLGDYTGLAYDHGIVHTVWSDNSNSTNDNPGMPAGATDTYYDRITFGTTYVGIEADIADARLLGIPGIELWATGTVKYNKASGPQGTLTPRMNWTAATQGANDPDSLLANLNVGADVDLRVTGNVGVDVHFSVGIVASAASAELNFFRHDVSDDSITLTDAHVLSIDVQGAKVFAGDGAQLTSDHTDLDTDFITANGVGFLATGIDFRMLLVRGADGDGANAGDSYLGIGAGLQSARLLGVDGLDFRASGTVKFNKATDASGTALSTRMNWTTRMACCSISPSLTLSSSRPPALPRSTRSASSSARPASTWCWRRPTLPPATRASARCSMRRCSR